MINRFLILLLCTTKNLNFHNSNLTNAPHFVKKFYMMISQYIFSIYKGVNENLFFVKVVVKSPIKILILFFCKFIILKIVFTKGPDENL